MAKYLDEQGLRTLWGKIKERDTNVYNNVHDEVTSVDTKATDAQTRVGTCETDISNLKKANQLHITSIDNLEGKITSLESGKLNASAKGVKNGVASLDENGKVPSSQLPSYVDDVLEYASKTNFPSTGETAKIYIAQDNNKTYRWSGTAYVEISSSLALGETASTAYAGDKGKQLATQVSGLYKSVTSQFNAIDNLETNKANKNDVYTKADIDSKVQTLSPTELSTILV